MSPSSPQVLWRLGAEIRAPRGFLSHVLWWDGETLSPTLCSLSVLGHMLSLHRPTQRCARQFLSPASSPHNSSVLEPRPSRLTLSNELLQLFVLIVFLLLGPCVLPINKQHTWFKIGLQMARSRSHGSEQLWYLQAVTMLTDPQGRVSEFRRLCSFLSPGGCQRTSVVKPFPHSVLQCRWPWRYSCLLSCSRRKVACLHTDVAAWLPERRETLWCWLASSFIPVAVILSL